MEIIIDFFHIPFAHDHMDLLLAYFFYTAVVQILAINAVFGQAAVTCSVTTHLL